MRKKINCLFLIMVMLVLTGCKAKYVLDYTDGVFTENIKLYDTNEFSNDSNYRGFRDMNLDRYMEINEGKKYNYKFIDGANGDILKVNYKYDTMSFDDSKVLNSCFENHLYRENDDYVLVHAYGPFLCSGDELSKLDIVLKTDNYVYQSNADIENVDEGTYIWHYKFGSDVEFQISKKRKKESSKKKFDINGSVMIRISIIFVVGFSILSFVLYLLKRSR